jgi:5-methylcytosine-specific restriction endonuclease McrA
MRADGTASRSGRHKGTDTQRGRTSEFKRNRTLVASTYGTVCFWCGKQTIPAQRTRRGQARHPLELTADHLIPLALGGSSHLENLRPCCLRCNTSRGHRRRPTAPAPTWRVTGTL